MDLKTKRNNNPIVHLHRPKPWCAKKQLAQNNKKKLLKAQEKMLNEEQYKTDKLMLINLFLSAFTTVYHNVILTSTSNMPEIFIHIIPYTYPIST